MISIEGFVNDLLSNCKISGTANTPATSTLFSIDEDSNSLSDEKKKRFHSITAKLLYYAKRITIGRSSAEKLSMFELRKDSV
jgi:hypothetical protein